MAGLRFGGAKMTIFRYPMASPSKNGVKLRRNEYSKTGLVYANEIHLVLVQSTRTLRKYFGENKWPFFHVFMHEKKGNGQVKQWCQWAPHAS